MVDLSLNASTGSTESSKRIQAIEQNYPKGLPSSSSSSSTATIEEVEQRTDDSEVGKGQTDSRNGVVIVDRTPIKVNRLQRRGLFASMCVIGEITEPKHYGNGTKWFLTFVVAVGAAIAPLGSGIIYPCLGEIAKDFDTTATVVNLCVALYMLSMSLCPIYWSAFSETFGRRNIYLISFGMNVGFNIMSAKAPSIGVMIASRILTGGASASVQAVGAGSIADLWEVHHRGNAMSIFYLGTLCGPLIAPIIGGALTQKWGWRSAIWFLVILAGMQSKSRLRIRSFLSREHDINHIYSPGVSFALFLFCLPETLNKTTMDLTSNNNTSGAKSSSTRLTRWKKQFKVIVLDPPKVIAYLRFIPILMLVYYASITFASLFVMNISIQDKFENEPYNYSSLIVGLLYIPGALGCIFATLFGGRWMDYVMVRQAKREKRFAEDGSLIYRPEDRMQENAWFGALLYPVALILYGWTAQANQFWFVPVRRILPGANCSLVNLKI
jgi:MFS family permease